LEGQLVLMGDENRPATNFPLGKCEADCDSDDDCEVCSLFTLTTPSYHYPMCSTRFQ
jgi:hypothetical protein